MSRGRRLIENRLRPQHARPTEFGCASGYLMKRRLDTLRDRAVWRRVARPSDPGRGCGAPELGELVAARPATRARHSARFGGAVVRSTRSVRCARSDCLVRRFSTRRPFGGRWWCGRRTETDDGREHRSVTNPRRAAGSRRGGRRLARLSSGEKWTCSFSRESRRLDQRSSGRTRNAVCDVSGVRARKSRRSSVRIASVSYSAASATPTASARSRRKAG